MSIVTSRAHAIVDKALDYRAARQDMIASNIANADTPFYKPRDISFQDALIAQKNKIFHKEPSQLTLAQTDKAHISLTSEQSDVKATLFFRDGHMARNDGNSVDIDVVNLTGGSGGIDSMGIEYSWQSAVKMLPDDILIQVVIEFAANSSREVIYFDNIEIRGTN